MPVPNLLPSNLPSLCEQLKHRTDRLRSEIVRANYKTQFAQTSPKLTEFRDATSGLIDEANDDVLCEFFRKTVPLTVYDSYAPFIARLLESPCRASAIVDLLAPGLPDFLTKSSSTSSGLQKHFLKYNCMAKIRPSDAKSWVVSDPLRKRTTASVYWLGVDRMSVVAKDNSPVAIIYRTVRAALGPRKHFQLDPEKDEEKMATFLLHHAAPYAAGFVGKWRSFLLIHMLFAVASRSLEVMRMAFITTFVDMIRYFDVEFEMMMDCLANGTIPDLEGTAEVRGYFEMNIFPDPERAEELRCIGRPSSHPGWCARVWPNLRSVTTISSGTFASSIPLARWFLGPDIQIRALIYASAEATIGLPYDPLESNQFKLAGEDLIEFLDISKSDSIGSLAQPWEVEVGTRYEVVVTTHDGLWRYRLGDVVEICGFDPTDGAPVMSFVERRNVAIRLMACTISEEDLRMAMSSLAPSMLTKVVNWTTMLDDRHVPATVSFFIELADDQGWQGMYDLLRIGPLAHVPRWTLYLSVPASDLAHAPDRVLDELKRLNQTVVHAVNRGVIHKLKVGLVRPGTFSDFLQLRLDEGCGSLGQVKVPVILTKPEYVPWFSDRVVQEL